MVRHRYLASTFCTRPSTTWLTDCLSCNVCIWLFFWRSNGWMCMGCLYILCCFSLIHMSISVQNAILSLYNLRSGIVMPPASLYWPGILLLFGGHFWIITILKLFPMVLWGLLLVFWLRLYWIYISVLWLWTIRKYWFTLSRNRKHTSVFWCLLQSIEFSLPRSFTCLVMLIPTYLIFDDIVNDAIWLIYF